MKSLFVYNPDNVGHHCHSPCLEKVNDQIFLTWYAYPEKEHENAKICFSSCSVADLSNWSKAKVCFSPDFKLSQGNPMLYFDSQRNELNLYSVFLKWTYWDSARIVHSIWDFQNRTWSTPQYINTPEAIMVRHRPIITKENILVPAYDEKSLQTVIYQSSYPFDQWIEVSKIDGKAIQADLIRTGTSEITAFFRSSGDQKQVYRALSADEGKNWTALMPTNLKCPWSGIAATKLNSQTIVVIHNDTESHSRGYLSVSLSHDQGVHFKSPKRIEGADIEVSYPSILRLDDENFLLAYTYARKMIKIQKINLKELVN